MARLKFGMIVTDMRGKLGGHVFTKSRQGATVRTKVTPVNRQTSAQGLIRGVFGNLSKQWNTLLEQDRQTWQKAAEEFKRTNVFGDQVALSGKNLFISLNTNIRTAEGVTRLTAPVESTVSTIATFNVSASSVTQTIDLAVSIPNDTDTNERLIVEATMQNSAGRYNFSGQYRQIVICDIEDLINEEDLGAAYVAKFGAIRAGSKISFRIYIINSVTGWASPKVVASTVVV